MGVMGCVQTKPEDERQADVNSRKIDKRIKEDAASSSKRVRLLLLGAAESGKSTIAKQLKILHQDGFSYEEKKSYRETVFTNIVSSMVSMINAMKSLEISYANEERLADAEKVVASSRDIGVSELKLTPEVVEALKRLWADDGLQSCFERSNEYQLNDSAKYFLDDLDRLSHPEYLPTEQDILRTRVCTFGIQETSFQYKGLDFTLIDVGGQRSERRKWIHCFQDVTAIVFCVSMSAYDQVLAEDKSTNRMVESRTLFASICNNPFFVNTAIILFLNKKDLFQEKVTKSPIGDYFEEFKGQNTYDEGCVFVRRMFEDINEEKKKREIYTHFTCATNTDNVRFVFDVISDVISTQILNNIFGPN